ncbi:hypothetical protein CASFOL_029916 [Castilleja foliolosa]|uniref:Uncharacterized protein n=1 Tax=Castilleja foliolosa TaxID=1961234 RepID=A0ABD3C9X4_9LAMI
MSCDDKNQRQVSARALIMPPPGPSGKPFSSSLINKPRFAVGPSGKKPMYNRGEISTTSSNTSSSSSRKRGPMGSFDYWKQW